VPAGSYSVKLTLHHLKRVNYSYGVKKTSITTREVGAFKRLPEGTTLLRLNGETVPSRFLSVINFEVLV